MTEFAAEIGSNHNGSLDRAIALIRKAAEIGCKAVKFQDFTVERLFAPKYLEKHKDLMLRRAWEVPKSWHEPLAAEAVRNHMRYGITVFSRKAADFEFAALHADYLKISSYQILDLKAIRLATKQSLPIVMSVGMADSQEVRVAMDVASSARRVTLLHCISAYPAMSYQSNLRSIDWLREEFEDCAVGWSDHTNNNAVLQRATHRYKADHIEFHLDLEGDGWEYSGGHCWLPDEIAPLIRGKPMYGDSGFYAMDGKKTKAPAIGEADERKLRSDPSDGLRPLLEAR